MKFFLILISTLTLTGFVNAQSSKRKPTKVKPIKVTVTVKSNIPPPKPLPTEDADGIWTPFELKEDNLKILLPATRDDVMDDVVGDVRSYQADTKRAKYLLVVRKLGVAVDNRNIENFLENLIEKGFVNSSTKIIERRNLSYEGRPGRGVISEERSIRSISRIYILDGKLFAMSVIIPLKKYDSTFEKWIAKFFDSFRVELKPVNSA